ncbi:hypothetical protein XENTR_v10020735 [Xenopus tropicalis]|nr:hypothetical protein XENTR_v10020735 [Xenopus tropicalis]
MSTDINNCKCPHLHLSKHITPTESLFRCNFVSPHLYVNALPCLKPMGMVGVNSLKKTPCKSPALQIICLPFV